jgi:hypothetical protein
MHGSLPRVCVVVTALAILSACGGGDNLSGGCDLGNCAGIYEGGTTDMPGGFWARVEGGTITIDDFFAACTGIYPDNRPCGEGVSGFDPPESVALNNSCQFTLRAQEGLVELTINGSVDPDTCRASGTYHFQYGSCCGRNGTWSAARN